jgi:hypothetical protein
MLNQSGLCRVGQFASATRADRKPFARLLTVSSPDATTLAHGLRITPAFLESRRADLNPVRRLFAA